MKYRWQVVSWILAGTFLVSAPAVRAEGAHRHDLAGRVTDARGAVVANAHIDITDQETGQTFSVLSDDAGRYLLSGLDINHHYTVLVRCIGYTSQTMRDVQITGDVLELTVTLRSF